VYDTKEEAFGIYHFTQESDDNWPESVEGPGGVDLTEEAERYGEELAERWPPRGPQPIGKVQVRRRDSDCWETADWIYPGNEPNEQLIADLRESFGAERVRYLTGPFD
jgi:hypothetical protein